MLKRLFNHLNERREFNRTKRFLRYRCNCRLTIALYTMGALRLRDGTALWRSI